MNSTIIRVFDILLATLAIILLSVPMLILALLIWNDDRGPVLFRQWRVGQNGAHFKILKFRTMTVDPDRFLGDASGKTAANLGKERAKFRTTTVNDPRITKIGRYLRSSHMDELPQFFNVLFGDMSIIGVRPDTPVQESDYSPDYWVERHRLRPGITGPAQLKSDTANLAQRSALELTWIQNATVKDYFRIIFATVLKVVKRSGN